MKSFLRSIALIGAFTFAINANAQIPDYGVWPSGVVLTDINGTTHNIDDILDAGKPVFIDAFADWCGPCWSYHQTKALENLYNSYGPNGTDELMVFGVETDASTPASVITDPNSHAQSGDWSAGTSFPLANDNNLAGIINQAYYPTIIMICPDRSVTEVGQKSTAVLYNYISTCGVGASLNNDPRIKENTSDEIFCAGGEVSLKVILQNFGTENLTAATIEAFDGTTSVLNKQWTGNLAPYAVTEVILGEVSPSAATTYSIKITSENDDVSNDAVQAIVNLAPVLEVGEISKNVSFKLNTDAYKSEIGIIFNEGSLPTTNFVTLHNNAAANPSEYLGFVQVGTYNDGNGTKEENWTVNNAGCHYAAFVDQYGDGYTYNYPNASIKLEGSGGSSLSVSPSFGSFTYIYFDVQFVNDLSVGSEEFASNFNVYPNPATNLVNVEFELQAEEEITISIINTVGQVVSTNNLGKVNGVHSTQVDVSNLNAGMYIIKLATKNGETTKRLSVQ